MFFYHWFMQNNEPSNGQKNETPPKCEVPSIIKDLAEAISTAVEVQNRYWLALAVTSLFGIVPQSNLPAGAKEISLPFGLPTVNLEWYALLMVLLLSVFIIAFAAAQAHLIRTQKIADHIIEKRKNEGRLIAGKNERYFLDALRKPSLGRVFSLAQVAFGGNGVFVDLKQLPSLRKHISSVLYLFFKITFLVVWLGLPGLALYYMVRYWNDSTLIEPLWHYCVVWPLVFAATLALIIAFYHEIDYIFRKLCSTLNASGKCKGKGAR